MQDEVHGPAEVLAELEARLDGWTPDLVGTLLFVVDGDRVLLIRKRRGHGEGKINGPGGKVEPGEAPLACAVRETQEEVHVRPHRPQLAAVFRFLDTEDDDWLGYVFVADGCDGTPEVTVEAIPRWYSLDDLPLAEMWEDDRFWLPRVLAGERLEGEFLFRSGRLLGHRLRPLEKHPAAG